jgi:hypothetical protein
VKKNEAMYSRPLKSGFSFNSIRDVKFCKLCGLQLTRDEIKLLKLARQKSNLCFFCLVEKEKGET